MSKDDFEIVRGSGNVFQDLGHPNAALEQLRSILAARIIKALDAQELTVRKAEELTGFAAADFSRIRRANLDRFTVDRLLTILGKLGDEVEVTISDRNPPRSRRSTRQGSAPSQAP
ncbi:MAG TPA: helix-turn-helix transcriptional regulator [Falsiroseomonas sp.]|jgi:predicted XRE-type DNA-binding protein|nr:helix-turn-helix transcriptional regulator [Falsiroseomonas sp.]